MRPRLGRFAAPLLLLLHPLLAAAYPGTLVETVAPYFAAARAGVQPGDLILGWSLADSPERVTPLSGAFALRDLEREQHPIQPVTLHGMRDGKPLVVTPEHGRWGLGSRPDWDSDIVARYNTIIELGASDVALAETEAATLSATLTAANDLESAAWVWLRLAGPVGKQGDWSTVSRLYRRALAVLAGTDFDKQRGQLHYFLASSLVRQNRLEEAEAEFQEAMALEGGVASERLAIAANQVSLGRLAARRGNTDEALEIFAQALALQQKLAPESLLAASTLNQIGITRLNRDELDSAESDFKRAAGIAEQRDPDGVAAAGYVTSLGAVHYYRGNLAEAEEHWIRALEMKQRMEPGSRNVSSSLHNLGLVTRDRGDLRGAQKYYRAALAIAEVLEPGSLDTMRTLNNLGTLALSQGDLANAAAYHEQVYQIRKAAIPDSLELAISLHNLGNVARAQGQLEKSARYFEEALDIQTRRAANTLRHARILTNLGTTKKLLGDPNFAREYIEKGLQIYESIAPGSIEVAAASTRLGDLLLELEKPDLAEPHYAKANTIVSELAPQTFRSATALHGLARVAEARDEIDVARDFYAAALRALDAQQLRLGGSDETRARARARYARIYQDAIRFQLATGDPTAAFEILERSRAKELSNMLAERDIVFSADIAEELEQRRRILAYRYEQTRAKLYKAAKGAAAEALQQQLLDIRRKQDALQRDIRDSAPGLAELHYPQALNLSELTEFVADGTAVISFNVDARHSDAFVVDRRGDLQVFELPISGVAVGDAVRRFRYLMDAGRWDAQPSRALDELALTLYQQLLAPLEGAIGDAQQLLIIPDGALNVLPFAALKRGPSQYVAEWKPSLTTNSLAVYSQLQQRRGSAENSRLVAFGNPNYPALGDSFAKTREGYDLGDLRPLPWSETEVRNIAGSYSNSNSMFVGSEATEERAKDLPADTGILHFATHATLDEVRPLDAAIVLSLPTAPEQAQENGFLHAWEIYESLRIDADLVTLSGCQTALGGDHAGEGLIGLTRAFHYAGAATVLASLWSVNDRSTSELMTAFYAGLDGEQTYAEALQQAQLIMLRGELKPSASLLARIRGWFAGANDNRPTTHPYHWAGFVLNGRGN